MAILNIGSVNIDHVYRVAHLPEPGETLPSREYHIHLGGKGANMSVAAARAGAEVAHAGAIGAEGAWCRARLDEEGIDVEDLLQVQDATGHAIINVDDEGENAIVIHHGANHALTEAQVNAALSRRQPGDWVLLQNETNLVAHAAREARRMDMQVAYAAAPFDAEATVDVLPHVDLLAVNRLEADQLAAHMGQSVETLPVPSILITMGADGAIYRSGGETHRCDALHVAPVDTTGAGDTFLGYFLAELSEGLTSRKALKRATTAAALQIMKPGAAEAIPTAREVDLLLERTDP